MFTVKSPSSNCSRISLRKTSSEGAGTLGRRGQAQRAPSHSLLTPHEGSPCMPLCWLSHSHEHGAADQEEEVEAVVVSEEGIPDPDDVGQQELLGQQQCQPAEGEELGLDVLLLLGRQRRGVGCSAAMQCHAAHHTGHTCPCQAYGVGNGTGAPGEPRPAEGQPRLATGQCF